MIRSRNQEIRKRAYQWVRRGEVPTLEEGILKGIKDAEVMNLHFVVPVTTHLVAGNASSNKAAPSSTASKGAGKSKNKGGGNKPTKKLHVKTPDGKPLCFKYNNNNKCTAKNCNFVHQCQRCLGSHTKSSCKAMRNDTSKGGGGD